LLEGGELDVAGGQIEIAGDLPDDLGDLGGLAVGFFDERVVDGALDLFLGDSQPNAAMALGVEINEERFLAESGQARSQVNARGCFSAAALLIDDGDGSHRKPSLVSSRLAADPSAAAGKN
jgi:hypothetical protein